MSRFSLKHNYDTKIGKEPITEDCPEWTRITFISILEPLTYVDHNTRNNNYKEPPIGIKSIIKKICKICREEMQDEEWDSWHCQENLFHRLKTMEWYYFYDSIELISKEILELEDNHFLEDEWIQKFGFKKFQNEINQLFNEDNIVWRLNNKGELTREIPNVLSKTVNKTENELKDSFEPARQHYKKALKYIYTYPIDPENGIKEIISAIESIGRSIFTSTRTLGDVIKELRKINDYPKELITIIEKFYLFTNKSPGVRHGASNPSKLDIDDAELSLHLGVSIIRYLIKKEKVRNHNNVYN
jgi:hypothetical protein